MIGDFRRLGTAISPLVRDSIEKIGLGRNGNRPDTWDQGVQGANAPSVGPVDRDGAEHGHSIERTPYVSGFLASPKNEYIGADPGSGAGHEATGPNARVSDIARPLYLEETGKPEKQNDPRC
jgi:hypothetical protein